MLDDHKPVETAAAFLAELGKTLKAREGVDVHLAEIVASRLLATAPEEDCVGLARAAIVALAAKRAGPSTEHADG